MLGAVRSLITLSLVVGGLWFSFSVDLGGKTLAEHVDKISETAEARELIDGTRARVNPALEDVKSRVLGEMIEAPTHLDAGEQVVFGATTQAAAPSSRGRAPTGRAPASSRDGASHTAADSESVVQAEPRLPGH